MKKEVCTRIVHTLNWYDDVMRTLVRVGSEKPESECQSVVARQTAIARPSAFARLYLLSALCINRYDR